MLKKYLKSVLLLFWAAPPVYLMNVFIALDFDIFRWSMERRGFSVALTMIIGLLTLFVINLQQSFNSKNYD